jgi:hypothetical protein
MFNDPGTIIYHACLAASEALISLGDGDKSGGGVKPPRSILVRQVPSVVEQLTTKHKYPSWAHAIFIFFPAGERHSNKTEVNLGYSVENGKVGLEWSRSTRRNHADKDKVIAFLQERHQTVVEQDSRIRYFRVEGENIIELGMQLLQEFYHLPDNAEIGMYTVGFDWEE